MEYYQYLVDQKILAPIKDKNNPEYGHHMHYSIERDIKPHATLRFGVDFIALRKEEASIESLSDENEKQMKLAILQLLKSGVYLHNENHVEKNNVFYFNFSANETFKEEKNKYTGWRVFEPKENQSVSTGKQSTKKVVTLFFFSSYSKSRHKLLLFERINTF